MPNGYRGIFKSTALIGGSAFISGFIRMAQNKVVAVLLGADGVALLATMTDLFNVVSNGSALGLQSSSVRQIAEAAGAEDHVKLSQTVIVYRRAVWATGLLGALILLLGAKGLSQTTFGSGRYVWAIAALAPLAVVTQLSAGQCAVLQGMRQISRLSLIRIFSALGGFLLVIPCYYLWGMQGVVPGMLAAAVVNLLVSWWHVRKIAIQKLRVSWQTSLSVLRPMLALGLSFAAGILIASLLCYLQKILLIRFSDLESCGYYQAGVGASGILVGFILAAMGTDYYPKLAGLLHNPRGLQQAVREQMEISLFLSVPGLVAMMIFAPMILHMLYSAAFVKAAILMQIFTFAVYFQVVSWPLGYVVMAHGHGGIYLVTQLVSAAIQLVLFYAGLRLWGVPGCAAAGVMGYFVYVAIMVFLLYWNYGVRLGWPLSLTIMAGCLLMGLVFVNLRATSAPVFRWGGNLAILLGVSAGCGVLLMRNLNLTMAEIKQRLLRERG